MQNTQGRDFVVGDLHGCFVVYVDTGIVYGHALTMINLAEPDLPIVMHRDPA
jgi:hypothetical protein